MNNDLYDNDSTLDCERRRREVAKGDTEPVPLLARRLETLMLRAGVARLTVKREPLSAWHAVAVIGSGSALRSGEHRSASLADALFGAVEAAAEVAVRQ